jgi:hypothetical protein
MRGLIGFILIIFLIALASGVIYRYKTNMKFESIDSTSTLTEPADTIEVKILQKDLDN